MLDVCKIVMFCQNDCGQFMFCFKLEDLLQVGVNLVVLFQVFGVMFCLCFEFNVLLLGSMVNFDFVYQWLVMIIFQVLMMYWVRDNVFFVLWDEGISVFQSNYCYLGVSQCICEGSIECDNYLMLKSGVNVGVWCLCVSNSLIVNSDDKFQWMISGVWFECDLMCWQSELIFGDIFMLGDVFDVVQFQGIFFVFSDVMFLDLQKGFVLIICGIVRINVQVMVW